MYIYKKLNHFAAYLKLTQHCKSTTFQYKLKTMKNFFNQADFKMTTTWIPASVFFSINIEEVCCMRS